MAEGITSVGLDAHKVVIRVAVRVPGHSKLVEFESENERTAVRRMVRKVRRLAPGEVRFCYEAGPCGYALQRWIREQGAACVVVAPSLIPRKPGERIKTDRRDARKLAEMFAAGMLTEVHPPTPEDEAARDLCRAREDVQQDVVRCRHRLSKMLLRQGFRWSGSHKAWSKGHRLWLASLKLEHNASQLVLEEYLLAIQQAEERLAALEQRVAELSQLPAYADAVAALRCFRGIDTTTAMCLIAELHNFLRFESPRGLMAFLGLNPSEHSSGEKERRGPITKAGNGHARRLLIEAAWHYRHAPAVGSALTKRRDRQAPEVIAVADKAMRRLYRRFRHMSEKGKPTPKIVVAIARELVGFIWAALRPLALRSLSRAA
jgi:transposase